MKRIVSVWLRDWPVTAWSWAQRTRPGSEAHDPALPFVLVERGARGLVLAGLNPAARAVGLRLGQAHADACAVVPGLMSEPVEAGQAEAALRRVALWAQRYAPATACDGLVPGMEGIWLDSTGADHLVGGEAALVADVTARLARAGAVGRVAVAGTPGAAWALARYGRGGMIAPPHQEAEALAGLPVEALRLAPAAVQLLRRFGLRRIGELYPLPRAGLARRFQGDAGMQVVRRLDQALGRAAEPLAGVAGATEHLAHQAFAEPILDAEVVAQWGALLAGALCEQLEREGLGARRLVLTGYRTDGRVTWFTVALGLASRDAGHMVRLLREKGWERLDVGFGLDALRLSAPVTEVLAGVQTDGLGGRAAADAETAMAGLVDRLTARLGEQAVLRPAFRETWLPEKAERLVPYAAASRTGPPKRRGMERPILLLPRPEPIETVSELPDGGPARFTWRRVTRRVMRASGPERVAPEWWRGVPDTALPRTRDYYRIEDEAGGRYWVFREGFFGAEERAPTWWMHGLFP